MMDLHNNPANHDATVLDCRPHLSRYYDLLESRIGYKLLLGGTRHFGYYSSQNDWPWPITPALRRMERKIYDGLQLPDGGKVLDCGCGIGHVSRYMAQHGLRVEAFDYMPRHVRGAKKAIAEAGLSDAVTLRQADYHHLDFFDENTFDGLFTCETLVHAVNPVQALREFYRVLKPSANLVLLEYAHEDPKDSKNVHRVRLKERLDILNRVADMPSFAEVGEMPKWIKEAGFVDIELLDMTQNIIPMMWLFWALAITPYFFVQLLGLEYYFPNVAAGVEMYRGRKDWHYYRITAKKPGNEGPGHVRARTKGKD